MGARGIAAAITTFALSGALLAGSGAFAGASAFAQQTPLPPPSFGRSIDIGLVSGTVIVTPPDQSAFALGTHDRNVPTGSLIDTTHGRVDLRAASSPVSGSARAGAVKVQDSEFYDGAFRVRQSSSNPVAQIRLAGGQLSTCTGSAAAASSSRLSHRVLRLLNASGHGKFQTEGRYAAATVRGTIWLTEDFCDGTLVRVTRGEVTVEDLVSHATVTVTAGHRYFARAPA